MIIRVFHFQQNGVVIVTVLEAVLDVARLVACCAVACRRLSVVGLLSSEPRVSCGLCVDGERTHTRTLGVIIHQHKEKDLSHRPRVCVLCGAQSPTTVPKWGNGSIYS